MFSPWRKTRRENSAASRLLGSISLRFALHGWQRKRRFAQMIDHSLVKLIHVSCVALSLVGFTLRAILMLKGSPLLKARWVRTIPHLVDSTLFFSGLWLAFNLQQYPGTTPWLTAKLLALITYIVFGALALRGRTWQRRYVSLLAAYLCFAYMVSVALTRSPMPWNLPGMTG